MSRIKTALSKLPSQSHRTFCGVPLSDFSKAELAKIIDLAGALDAGSITFGVCPVCNDAFFIDHGKTRSHKRFCSDNCRVKSWQRQKGVAVS